MSHTDEDFRGSYKSFSKVFLLDNPVISATIVLPIEEEFCISVALRAALSPTVAKIGAGRMNPRVRYSKLARGFRRKIMDIKLQIQSTPNPNALKFVLSVPVKTEGKATYKNPEECHTNPLARLLFSVPHVSEVYFFENYITITQDGQGDWDGLEEQIKSIILNNIKDHDPNFSTETVKKIFSPRSPEIEKIEAILDQTIRPALQSDGGDLQIISFENNILTVNYQGACGSCLSSAMGTLKAIENILKEEFNPETVVQLA